MGLESRPYYLQVPASAGKLRQRFVSHHPVTYKIDRLRSQATLTRVVVIIMVVVFFFFLFLSVLDPTILGLSLPILFMTAVVSVVLTKWDSTSEKIETVKTYHIDYEYLEFYEEGLVVSPFMNQDVDFDPKSYYNSGYSYIPHEVITEFAISAADPVADSGLRLAVIEFTTVDGVSYRLNYEEAPYFMDPTDDMSDFIVNSNLALEEFRHIQNKISRSSP